MLFEVVIEKVGHLSFKIDIVIDIVIDIAIDLIRYR